jgi:hypothetical protein
MRKATKRLLGMMEDGMISHQAVAEMCLSFMSEYEVAEMMDANELSKRFEQFEDDEE